MFTYTTAASRSSTAQKANKNAPGPIRPILVINLLTDKTDHLFCIKVSALWPATIKKKDIFFKNVFKNNIEKYKNLIFTNANKRIDNIRKRCQTNALFIRR